MRPAKATRGRPANKPGTPLGSAIRAARLKAKLTGAELAAQVGCSPGTISEYESGAHAPTIGRLQRIAAALGVEPGKLLR